MKVVSSKSLECLGWERFFNNIILPTPVFTLYINGPNTHSSAHHSLNGLVAHSIAHRPSPAYRPDCNRPWRAMAFFLAAIFYPGRSRRQSNKNITVTRVFFTGTTGKLRFLRFRAGAIFPGGVNSGDRFRFFGLPPPFAAILN